MSSAGTFGCIEGALYHAEDLGIFEGKDDMLCLNEGAYSYVRC